MGSSSSSASSTSPRENSDHRNDEDSIRTYIALDPSGTLGSLFDESRDTISGELGINLQPLMIGINEPVICELYKGRTNHRENLLDMIGIDPLLQLSILCRIIPIPGMSSIIDYPHQIDDNTRFFYFRQEAFRESCHEELHINTKSSSPLSPTISATHIITEITRGIHAIIIVQLPTDQTAEIDLLLKQIQHNLLRPTFVWDLSVEEINVFERIISTTVYSNIPDLTGLEKLIEVFQKILQIMRNNNGYRPLSYTLTAIRSIDPQYRNTHCFYDQINSNQVEELNYYLYQQFFWMNAPKWQFDQELAKLPVDQLEKPINTFRRAFTKLTELYEGDVNKIHRTVHCIRKGELRVDWFDGLSTSAAQVSIKKKIQEIHACLDALILKGKLIQDLQEHGFQYWNVARFGIDKDCDEQLMKQIFFEDAQEKILLCFTDQLKQRLPTRWNELRHEILQEKRKHPQVTLVYADFSYSTWPLQEIKILLSKEPPLSRSQPVFTTITLELEPEPESEPESDRKLEPEPESDRKPEPESESDRKLEPEPEPEPESDRKPEPEPESDRKPEPEPESDRKLEPETEPERKPKNRITTKTRITTDRKPEPESKSDRKLEPEPEPESDRKPEPEPESDRKLEPEPESDRKPEPEPESDRKLEPEPESDRKPELEPESDRKPEPESESDRKLEPEPESDRKLEPESESEQKTESQPKLELQREPEPEPEPKLELELERRSELEPKLELEPEQKVESKSESELEPESDRKLELELELKPEPERRSELEPELELEPEQKVESESESELGSESVSELEPEPEPKAEPEPQPTVEYINVLLLGESGVGKSTFINAFANYLYFDSLEKAKTGQPVVVIPVSFVMTTGEDFEEHSVNFGEIDPNENHNDVGQSVTQQCRAYLFRIAPEKKLRIIDTPGFADTRGFSQDQINMNTVFSFVKNLPHLNAVFLLHKPGGARLNPFLYACFTEIFEWFGEGLRDHLIFCFTNTRATFFVPGDTGPLLRSFLKTFPVTNIPFAKKNVFCFDSESFRYLVALQNHLTFDEIEEEDFVQSWTRSVDESERLRTSLCEVFHPYRRNVEWRSEKDAQCQINLLIRPILEGIRNILRNTILLATSCSIILKATAVDHPTTIYYKSDRVPKQLEHFWIYPDLTDHSPQEVSMKIPT